MFIHTKSTPLISYILLTIFSLSPLLYGTRPKRAISKEEAHMMRHRKGECWIPYEVNSWKNAIIISYLYSRQRRKKQREERLERLQRVHKLDYPRIFKKPIILPLSVNFDNKKKGSNDYISFVEEYHSSFNNFIYNINLTSSKDCFQTVANALETNIQIYEISEHNPCELNFVCTLEANNHEWPPIRIVRDNSYVHPAEITSQYKKAFEKSKPIAHYRPLLSDPAGWWSRFQNNKRSFQIKNSLGVAQSPIPVDNNSSQNNNNNNDYNNNNHNNNDYNNNDYNNNNHNNNDYNNNNHNNNDYNKNYYNNNDNYYNNYNSNNNQLIYNSSNNNQNNNNNQPSTQVGNMFPNTVPPTPNDNNTPFESLFLTEAEIREDNIRSQKTELLDSINKVDKELNKLLDYAYNELAKSINIYDIKKTVSCMRLCKTTEETKLRECLSSKVNLYRPYKDLKNEILEETRKIIKNLERLDFTSQEYQQQSRSNKVKWFKLFNKKICFALGIAELWPNHDENISLSSIKKTMMDKIKEEGENIKLMRSKKRLKEKNCEKINAFFQTCELFCKYMVQEKFDDAKEHLKKVQEEFMDYLTEIGEAMLEKATNNLDNYKELASILVQISIIEQSIDQVYIDNTGIEGIIETILKKFKENSQDENVIELNNLSVELRKTSTGGRIVAESPIFRGIAIMLRNTAFDSIDFSDILTEIREYQASGSSEEKIDKTEIDESCLAEIEEAYMQFKEEYWKLVENNLGDSDATQLIRDILHEHIEKDVQTPNDIEWDDSMKEPIPYILAGIFAYWTLRNNQHYNDASGINDKKERKKYLLQPHSAQVVAIMRILGIGKDDELSNHLIQIGTGEGKSVVAFATSLTLAILGFDVSCVCYSEYLSLRDHNEFMPLIKELGMDRYIRYTTFNNLCESIINEKGDVRTELVKLIHKNSSSNIQVNQNNNSNDDQKDDSDSDSDNDNDNDNDLPTYHSSTFSFSPDRARIIFIDEVDVFFNKDFYGSPYSPTAIIHHPSIQKLLEFVWDNRNNDLYFKKVASSEPYKECITIFNQWKEIIREAVMNMLADVNEFNKPEYVIHHNELCYEERDTISSKINYQYKTAFACLYEEKNITKENLRNRLGIYLNCGTFSYAEIPNTFDRIIGVTGTLDNLGSVQLEILAKYNIKQHTFMPSLYGKSKREFFKNSSKGLKIIGRTYYDNNLKKEILKHLEGKENPKDQRAVIVFFETPEKLDSFYQNPKMETLRRKIVVMKSDLSFEEKSRRITKAANSGNITFSIREFGRGTDFVCYDPTVDRNGGVHVIITFFPENISEETQIIGRTARQRNEGSVSMLLEKESIEGLMPKEIVDSIADKSGDFYDDLNEQRNKVFASNYTTSIQYVEQIREHHKKAIKFREDLLASDIQPVIQHLLSYNQAPEPELTHTIILVDATASMGELLTKTQIKITEMFDRINKILENYGKPNAFALQFVAYRNYDAPPNLLLQVSSWESRAENLRQFMNNVNPQYGWGNEAIEVGFAHVLRESKNKSIDQVILIGDMPPNTRDEVSYKRRNSEINWSDEDSFYSAPYYEDSLDKIKEMQIPIHTFHIPPAFGIISRSSTKEAFTKIAEATEGKCELLNIHHNKGAEQLTDIVSIAVLAKTAGNAAVDAYNKMFKGKSYL